MRKPRCRSAPRAGRPSGASPCRTFAGASCTGSCSATREPWANSARCRWSPGTLIALLGPSGCGKTTLLRIIAGLDAPDEGQVLFDGRDATLWPIRDRNVGFVFQHYALFRHMSVFENVAFGLKVKARRERPSSADIRRKVQSLLELV